MARRHLFLPYLAGSLLICICFSTAHKITKSNNREEQESSRLISIRATEKNRKMNAEPQDTPLPQMEIEWILISYFCCWHILKFDLLATCLDETKAKCKLHWFAGRDNLSDFKNYVNSCMGLALMWLVYELSDLNNKVT